MINYCPYCGFSLDRPILDGISTCKNCSRVFDTNPFNRILSASWMARKQHLLSKDKLVQYGFTEFEATLIQSHVIEDCLPHDEFVKVLTSIGVSTIYEPLLLNLIV